MGVTAGTEILERERELATLDSRLEDALAGEGGLVLVEGSAGVGKTVLLSQVRARATARGGVRALRAVGGELERDFPFGIVRQLFEPVVLGAPQGEQDRLLSGAAAVAGRVVGAAPDASEPSADASFATLHGLYWLVAAMAEKAPLLLLIDDAHWGDPASLRFVDFLARRAQELPVLVVVGFRPAEPGSERDLLSGLAEAPGTDVLRPAPLSGDAVRRLVTARLEATADDGVVEAALEATGGNPLLLNELARTLARAGAAPTVGAVQEALPSSVTRSVERRLARLPEDARAIAGALAVLGQRRGPDVLAAATGLEPARVVEALESLEVADLVEGDPPTFVHPLLRSAVAERVGVAERHRLHRTVAELLRHRPGHEDEVVMHVLAAPAIGEEWAVDVLRAAAARAIAEGAPDAAVKQLRRALEESSGDNPELQLELGRAAVGAGDRSFLDHLKAATRSEDRAVASTALETLVGVGAAGSDSAVAALLRASFERLAPGEDPAQRDRLGGALVDTYTLELRAAERASVFAAIGEDEGSGVGSHRIFELAARDTPASEVRERGRELFAGRPFTYLRNVEYPKPFWAVEGLGTVDEAAITDEAIGDAEITARRFSSRLGRAFVAFLRAEWALTYGSMVAAESGARESLELWQQLGIEVSAESTAAALVQALVRRGALEEAEAVLGRMQPDDHFEHFWGGGSVWLARAEARLAQGRPYDAVSDLRRIQWLTDRFGWARFPRGAATALLARALVASGQREEGQAIAEKEAADSRRRGAVMLEAEALVSLGHALEGEAGLEALRAAVEVSQQTPARFTRATAAYEYGAALRRSGRRSVARDQLSAARDLAYRIEATALVTRATDELAVAGARPRRIALSGAESLSAAERRVAELAADGLSNREIAETLFVTRKTVESQLGAAYTKLDIRSRSQLAEKLGAPASVQS